VNDTDDKLRRVLACLAATNDEELMAALTVAEAQFAQGQYKTLEEAEAILAAAWRKDQEIDDEYGGNP
jgi:hypothetical protein